jgi:hypothetical protein
MARVAPAKLPTKNRNDKNDFACIAVPRLLSLA